MGDGDAAAFAEAGDIASAPFLAGLKNRSILVTGASGMLGGYLVLSLLRADERHGLGLTLYALARDRARLEAKFSGLPAHIVAADVCDPGLALPPCDTILHAASPVGPAMFDATPAQVTTANLTGTVRLLETAARTGARFLFVSTHEVYGAGKPVWREEEYGALDFLSPRSCYPESKRAAENACVCFGRQYDVDFRIVRPSRIYGPTMNLDSGLFICDFFRDALAGKPITINGGGDLLRPLCYIRDVAEAALRILVLGAPGSVCNIAPQKAHTIREIARALSSLTGVPVSEIPSPSGNAGGAVQDISLLAGLGWRQTVCLSEGLKRTWLALSRARP